MVILLNQIVRLRIHLKLDMIYQHLCFMNIFISDLLNIGIDVLHI